MLQAIDARSARHWALTALAALAEAREELDALNVYPVPDGDTGTNLYLTIEAAVDAVATLPPEADVREVIAAFAHGALMGARGNSGIIAAQLLRGWSDVLAEHEVLDGAAAKQAVQRADEQAWRAVGDPVEGTILSVSRAAATAAQTAPDDLPHVVSAIVTAAREALARTPDQLEALRRAGVVDAGGKGYLVVLEALEDLVYRRSGGGRGRRQRAPRRSGVPRVSPAQLMAVADDLRPGGPAYEVMFLLDADDAAMDDVRGRLAHLGDSLVVVGGDRLWHIHVHTDDPGAAVEVGIAAGRPHRIRIAHFADQATGPLAGRRGGGVALVACAAGPGLARLFSEVGAVVVEGGARRRPSTAQILEAIRAAQAVADAVVVLPNDGDTLAVAQAAASSARTGGARVSVLPTRAQVQGLAAAAVHDRLRSVDDDVVSMSAAAGATRDGALTLAVREALTMGGVCRPGDVLGIVAGDIVVVGADLVEVGGAVLERLLTGGGELVSLVVGAQAPPELAPALAALVRRGYPGVEVSVLDGGQPRYPILIGVE